MTLKAALVDIVAYGIMSALVGALLVLVMNTGNKAAAA
jgi:hypothetical protein